MASKSNKTVSKVDQRLAAAMHLRQIESIIQLESLADDIDVMFFTAGSKLVDVAAAGKSDPRISEMLFANAFSNAQNILLTKLESFANQAFDSSVDAMAKAIPNAFFRVASPAAMIAGLEDETGAAFELPSKKFSVGDLIVDIFTEPIIGRKKRYSKKQWREILKQLVFTPPSRSEVQDLINTPDNNGLDWQDRLLQLSSKVSDAVRMGNQLAFGFSQGENLQQLKRRALPLVQGIQSSARRIVRTEGLRIAERIQRRSWDALGDMMVGVQLLAVLDERTRPEHATRNGRIFYREPSGDQRPLSELPDLPDQPNCRCWSTPVLKPPKELENDPAMKEAFKTASGAGIPDPATYNQWFANTDVGRRKMVVGVGRYKEVEKQFAQIREPQWSDFIDEDGRLLSISELQGESAVERQARKDKVDEEIRKRGEQVRAISRRGFLLPGDVVPGEVLPTANAPVPDAPAASPALPALPPLAKTIKQAVKIALQHDLADNINFTGLHVDVANDMIQGVASAIAEFPGLRKNLKFIGAIQARNKFLVEKLVEKMIADRKANGLDLPVDKQTVEFYKKIAKRQVPKTPGNVYAYSFPGDIAGGIGINSKWGKNPEKMRATLQMGLKVGHNPIGCDTIRSVVDHEMGHEIDKLLSLASRAEFTDNTIRQIMSGYTREQVGQELSIYAKKNCKEVIAEAWAEFQNNPDPRPIAMQIGRYIQSRREATQ